MLVRKPLTHIETFQCSSPRAKKSPEDAYFLSSLAYDLRICLSKKGRVPDVSWGQDCAQGKKKIMP